MTAPIVELTDAERAALKQLIPVKLREHPEDPMISVGIEDTLRTEVLLERARRIKANAYAAGAAEVRKRVEALLAEWEEGADAWGAGDHEWRDLNALRRALSGEVVHLINVDEWHAPCGVSTGTIAFKIEDVTCPDCLRKTPDPGGAPNREDGEPLDPRQDAQSPAVDTLPGQVEDAESHRWPCPWFAVARGELKTLSSSTPCTCPGGDA